MVKSIVYTASPVLEIENVPGMVPAATVSTSGAGRGVAGRCARSVRQASYADIASIDMDGFVTLHGRADCAINRGGFKIQPETIRRVLISHPAVRDACVVGVPDKRLGQVPFAAIEPTAGMPVPSADELKDLVRQALPVYNVPVDFTVVDELPRNPALKGEPACRRRALRPARKQVVARRILAVVIQRRFIT